MVVDLDEEEQKAIIDFINNHDFEEEDLDEDGYPQIIKIPVRKLLPFAS